MRVLREQTGRVRCVAFSPAGRRLAAGGRSTAVCVWDTASWEFDRALAAHRTETRALAFHPDGERLAVGGTPPRGVDPPGNTVWLWNPGTSLVERVLRCPGSDPVTGLAFHPDGTRLYACWRQARSWYGGASGYWRFLGRGARFVPSSDGWVKAVAVSADGRVVVEGGDHFGIWVTQPGRSTAWPLHLKPARVKAVAVRPDGLQAAAGHGRKVTLFVPFRYDEPTAELPEQPAEVRSVAYSPDGRTLAGGAADGSVVFWDPAAGTELRRLDPGVGPVNAVAFAPDGLTLAVAGDRGLAVVDVG